MRIKLLNSFFLLLCLNFYGQSSVVKGKILSSSDNTPITTATISVAGSTEIAFANENGTFVLEINQAPPFEIQVEAIGFEKYKHRVLKEKSYLSIHLDEDITSLDQVVLSASRTPERVFESPVSIERMGAKAVETTTSASFYDGLENLKGVDVNTSSLTFKSVNTRGFSSFANTRFVQLVDGVDNASPGLNFALGNMIGLNELDVHSVELLPGASSALYGANAFNGIMIMRSKSPFTHEGISVYTKSGVTSSEDAGTNHFIDAGFRIAEKFNDKFAVKLTASLFKGTDWFATDARNANSDGKIIEGGRYTTEGDDYNGVNVYGDEYTNPEDLGFGRVTRTGYDESDLVDYGADSFKAAVAFHFKPFDAYPETEIILGSKYGTGNAIYQGASRYALRNFSMHQHKLEVKTKNLMFRVYASIEDAGDSYDIRFAGINTLRSANAAVNGYNALNSTDLSVDQLWFGTYGNAYGAALGGGASEAQARVAARNAADANFRTDPTSEEFKTIFNSVIKNPDLTTGAKFVDNSQLYHSDFNYNFRDKVKFAEIQVGASTRRYVLDSDGTIFTDSADGTISYNEYGIYTQLQRKLVDDRLKVTGSIRYDKAQNFDGNFSPRLSVSFSPDEDKKHNIRASFQTGFRNPTTQEQYIGVDLGNTLLLGSVADNPERYNKVFEVNSDAGMFAVGGDKVNFIGTQAYTNSFTRASVENFGVAVAQAVPQIIIDSGGTKTVAQASSEAAALNSGVLEKAEIGYIKPEHVTSYEIGYRGKVAKKTVLDVSAYYNSYKDFVSIVTVIAPLYGDVSAIDPVNVTTDQNTQLLLNAVATGEYTPVSLYANTKADVSSYGVNAGLETTVGDGYNLGINYAFSNQDIDDAKSPGYEAGFNTPKHKVKASFGNNNVYNNLGFGLNIRWQDKYYWASSFIDETIEARTIVDVQAMYHLESWNSKIKIGGVNILGEEYVVAPGTGRIGSQFYASWTLNF